jgi:ABC-type Fe3+ transport system substrate-binding protein
MTTTSRALAGAPVEAIFPDQDGAGTLLIPNSVALLRGAPHAAEAKKTHRLPLLRRGRAPP